MQQVEEPRGMAARAGRHVDQNIAPPHLCGGVDHSAGVADAASRSFREAAAAGVSGGLMDFSVWVLPSTSILPPARWKATRSSAIFSCVSAWEQVRARLHPWQQAR